MDMIKNSAEEAIQNKQWFREDDIMLAFMRILDYYHEFNIREWKDVLNIVDINLWRKIANDSRLGHGRFTDEECYRRFEEMIQKYEMLRSLPRLERILPRNDWHVYKYIHWYYKKIQQLENNFNVERPFEI